MGKLLIFNASQYCFHLTFARARGADDSQASTSAKIAHADLFQQSVKSTAR
jgi:hypothetical protein